MRTIRKFSKAHAHSEFDGVDSPTVVWRCEVRSGAQLPSSLALNSRLCVADDDDDAYVCFGLSWSVDRAKGEFDVKFRLGLFKEKPGHRGMSRSSLQLGGTGRPVVILVNARILGRAEGARLSWPLILSCPVFFFPLSLFFPPFIILGKCKALWGKPRTLLRLSQTSTELSCTRFDEERSKKSKTIEEQRCGTVLFFAWTHPPTHEFDCRTSSGCSFLWGTHVGGHTRTRYRVGTGLRLPMRKKENVEERWKQLCSRSQLAPS